MTLANAQVTRLVEALRLAGIQYCDSGPEMGPRHLVSISEVAAYEPWRGRLVALANDIITIVGRERVVELDTAVELLKDFSQHSRKE